MEVEFDQHYLKNESVLRLSIESSDITNDDIILEIGPGTGILTRKILDENPKKLIAVELDIKHREELDKIESETLELFFGNALDMFDSLNFNKIIANIPYAITENLYSKIIDREIPFVVLLHGMDFYKNIVERETRWKYIVPAFYDITLLEVVDGDAFIPPTKVKSSLVKLELKKEHSKFDIFMQMFFYKRHRSLQNALVYSLVDSLGISKKEASSMIKDFEFPPLLMQQKVTQLKNRYFMYVINQIKGVF
jgi:16S rRNA (adenine1518-N6/adenine1519-N6)-dimethyltransferase